MIFKFLEKNSAFFICEDITWPYFNSIDFHKVLRIFPEILKKYFFIEREISK